MQTVNAQLRISSVKFIDHLFEDENVINPNDLPEILQYISFRDEEDVVVYGCNIPGYREVTYNKKSKDLYGLTLDNKFHIGSVDYSLLVEAFVQHHIDIQEGTNHLHDEAGHIIKLDSKPFPVVEDEKFTTPKKARKSTHRAAVCADPTLSDIGMGKCGLKTIPGRLVVDTYPLPKMNKNVKLKNFGGPLIQMPEFKPEPIPFPNLNNLSVNTSNPKDVNPSCSLVPSLSFPVVKDEKIWDMLYKIAKTSTTSGLRFVSKTDREFILNDSWLISIGSDGKFVLGKFPYGIPHKFKPDYYEELIPLTFEEVKEATNMCLIVEYKGKVNLTGLKPIPKIEDIIKSTVTAPGLRFFTNTDRELIFNDSWLVNIVGEDTFIVGKFPTPAPCIFKPGYYDKLVPLTSEEVKQASEMGFKYKYTGKNEEYHKAVRIVGLRYNSDTDGEFIFRDSWLLDIRPTGNFILGKFPNTIPENCKLRPSYYNDLIELTSEEQKEVIDMGLKYEYTPPVLGEKDIYPVLGKFYSIPGTWYELVHYMINGNLKCYETFTIDNTRYTYYEINLNQAAKMIKEGKHIKGGEMSICNEENEDIRKLDINVLRVGETYKHYYAESVEKEKIMLSTDRKENLKPLGETFKDHIFYMYSIILKDKPKKIICYKEYNGFVGIFILCEVGEIKDGLLCCYKMSHELERDIEKTYTFLHQLNKCTAICCQK